MKDFILVFHRTEVRNGLEGMEWWPDQEASPSYLYLHTGSREWGRGKWIGGGKREKGRGRREKRGVGEKGEAGL